MGFCAALRRCLEPEDVQQQNRCPGRLGNVLRPRRALLLSLAGRRAKHHTGRPFGINQQQPFVGTQFCPTAFPGTLSKLAAPPCRIRGARLRRLRPAAIQRPLQFRTPVTGIPALPNAADLENGDIPFYLGVYARNNKLPYTMNTTLDIQWQPRNDLAIDIGDVNALGPARDHSLALQSGEDCNPNQPAVRAGRGLRKSGRLSACSVLYLWLYSADGIGAAVTWAAP